MLFAALVAAFLAVVIWLYVRDTGGPPSGADVDTSRITDLARDQAQEIYAQPWFWTAAGAGVLAVLGFMTWRRIGGWGRASVLVLVAVAFGAWVSRP